MEIYTVNKINEIDYGATGIAEILQNVAFILSTYKYSCPLDREFGWEPSLDNPIDQAEAENTAAIIEAIEEYEPRATIVEIIVESDKLEGHQNITVRVGVDDGSTI
ncbi:GPW/gp25 family protein [Viridibacillus arvi]|uniref:GPW/gp25 family protein n=1 Tax=Viridibacillus arvi TaxID=263475 RepID=UPI0034CD2E58